MAPYRMLGEPAGCQFINCVPREGVAALLQGKALAAAVPVGGLPVLKGIVEPLGRFGIAAKERSASVLFFSDRPFDTVKAPVKIFVTDESESSVRLLYLLFGYRHGFDCIPGIAGSREEANGELIIGDAALQQGWLWRTTPGYEIFSNRPCSRYNYVTDLASEWYAIHKLPFVFARWVMRTDAPLKARRALEDWLAEFQVREKELVDSAVPGAVKALDMPYQHILDYFHVIRRTLHDEDLAGQELFLQEIQKHGRDPLFSGKQGVD